MERTIDLHTHTTASDGTLSPAELVTLAQALGLTAVAITDHDTMSGVAPALEAGAALGVEVLPGIEISTDYQGVNTHVLGYGLDSKAPALAPVLDWVSRDRRERNAKIAARMRADGIDVSLASLEQRFPGGTVGRPHFARALVELGRADSVPAAFARYLNPGGPYYIPRSHIPMHQAVEVIRQCGGVAVLAHPLQYGHSLQALEALVAYAARVGVEGLECHYTGYTPEQQAALCALAQRYDLLITGGSDFHGDNKPTIALGRGYGSLAVPEVCLQALRARLSDK